MRRDSDLEYADLIARTGADVEIRFVEVLETPAPSITERGFRDIEVP